MLDIIFWKRVRVSCFWLRILKKVELIRIVTARVWRCGSEASQVGLNYGDEAEEQGRVHDFVGSGDV